jgi:non-homologous end joining protein Ku
MPEAPARSNVVDLTALLKQSLSKSADRNKSRSRKASKSKAGAGASRRQAA